MGAPKGHPAYNLNGEGGRPLKYTVEFIEKEADAFEEWMKLPKSIYFKRFSFDRGYSAQRLSEFAEQNERFSEVYSRAKEWQEIRLTEGGLTSEFNSGFCKFVMGNVCGWADKTETKHSGDGLSPLQFIFDRADGGSKELIDEET